MNGQTYTNYMKLHLPHPQQQDRRCVSPHVMDNRKRLSRVGGNDPNESASMQSSHYTTRANNVQSLYPRQHHRQQPFASASALASRIPEGQRCDAKQSTTSYHTSAAPLPTPTSTSHLFERREGYENTTHMHQIPAPSPYRVMPSHAVSYLRSDLTERSKDRRLYRGRDQTTNTCGNMCVLKESANAEAAPPSSSVHKFTRNRYSVNSNSNTSSNNNVSSFCTYPVPVSSTIAATDPSSIKTGTRTTPHDVRELCPPDSIGALSHRNVNSTASAAQYKNNNHSSSSSSNNNSRYHWMRAQGLIQSGNRQPFLTHNAAVSSSVVMRTPLRPLGFHARDDRVCVDGSNSDSNSNDSDNNTISSRLLPSRSRKTSIPHGLLLAAHTSLYETDAGATALCLDAQMMSISDKAIHGRANCRSHAIKIDEKKEIQTDYSAATKAAAPVTETNAAGTPISVNLAHMRLDHVHAQSSDVCSGRRASTLNRTDDNSAEYTRSWAGKKDAMGAECEPEVPVSGLFIYNAPCASGKSDSCSRTTSKSSCSDNYKHAHDQSKESHDTNNNNNSSSGDSNSKVDDRNKNIKLSNHGLVDNNCNDKVDSGERRLVMRGAADNTIRSVHRIYSPLSVMCMSNLTLFERQEIQSYLPVVYFTGTPGCAKINVLCHEEDACGGSATEKQDRTSENGGGSSRSSTNSNTGMHCNGNNNKRNNGYDDEMSHYRVVVGDHMAYRYEIMQVIGRGTFGIVVKAYDHCNHRMVALKIIKNKPNYRAQADVEVQLLEQLGRDDPDDVAHIVRLLDVFNFRNHFVLVFELLPRDLYNVMQASQLKPFSRRFIVRLAQQILVALAFAREHNILHCDIKPENIMIRYDDGRPEDDEMQAEKECDDDQFDAKLIDFGSACTQGKQIYTYIQSRYYRAPEVVAGLPCTPAIDMWSFGCMLCELAHGKPIFPATSEVQLLDRISEYLGPYPEVLRSRGRRVHKFYSSSGALQPDAAVLARKTRCEPGQRQLTSFLSASDSDSDILFVDFIRRCLDYDPATRLTPKQALQHGWLST